MAKQELMPARRELNPFREMMEFQKFSNKLFEDFFNGGSLQPKFLRQGNGETAWYPDMDIQETDDELVAYVSLPGVEKKDINVEVTDNALILRGERRCHEEESGKTWLRRECSYGSFYRAFDLPSVVDSKKVKAQDKNGILEIHLPKIEQAKPRHVNVE